MAIVFECPNCGERYRLQDSAAGKRAKCKNPQCGKLLLIPQPQAATVPPPFASLSPPPDVEATALSVLSDAPEPQEHAAAARPIPMTSKFRHHDWTAPLSKAGKH